MYVSANALFIPSFPCTTHLAVTQCYSTSPNQALHMSSQPIFDNLLALLLHVKLGAKDIGGCTCNDFYCCKTIYPFLKTCVLGGAKHNLIW